MSIRDVFEPGFIIEVAFNTGKVLKFKDGDNSEPQDYSQIFQSLVKAGIFRDSDNSYTIQFDDGRIELAFERTEGAEGPVFRIVIADKARRIKDILKEETFEDLRYALKGDVAELFRNGIRYETVRVKEIEKDITERILREKQNFYSIEGPEFGIASFRAANTA